MAVSRVSEKATASKPPKVESSNTTTRAKILLVWNDAIRSYPPRCDATSRAAFVRPQLRFALLWCRAGVPASGPSSTVSASSDTSCGTCTARMVQACSALGAEIWTRMVSARLLASHSSPTHDSTRRNKNGIA
jgi:hypothetical protein